MSAPSDYGNITEQGQKLRPLLAHVREAARHYLALTDIMVSITQDIEALVSSGPLACSTHRDPPEQAPMDPRTLQRGAYEVNIIPSRNIAQPESFPASSRVSSTAPGLRFLEHLQIGQDSITGENSEIAALQRAQAQDEQSTQSRLPSVVSGAFIASDGTTTTDSLPTPLVLEGIAMPALTNEPLPDDRAQPPEPDRRVLFRDTPAQSLQQESVDDGLKPIEPPSFDVSEHLASQTRLTDEQLSSIGVSPTQLQQLLGLLAQSQIELDAQHQN